MSRIIAGVRGGRRLLVPSGRGTRPTSDRVREAMFSRLEHLDAIQNAHVLDLYAGSGALGLEAASRGAASVLLVESNRRAVSIIRRNVDELGLAEVAVEASTVEQVLATTPTIRRHLVLLDPPYDVGEDQVAAVLEALVTGRWLADDAVLVVERSTRSPEPVWPADIHLIGPRRYGETTCWFAEYVPEGATA